MARRRRKGEAAQVGSAGSLLALARDARALSARGADRLADPGQPRLDRAGAGHDHLPRRQRRPRRHHHAGRGAGARLAPLVPQARLRRAPTRCRLDRVRRRASSGSISNTPTWWDITPRTIWSALAGGKRVMHVEYVAEPRLRRARDPPAARGISPAVGRDPRRFRARRARPAAAHRPSRLRPAPTPSIARPARRARSAPATAGSPTGCGSPGSRPACGRRSSQGLVWRYRKADQST